MPPDWDELQHAYGTASDIPQFFEHAGDPDMAPEAWDELWSSLCHQGTVYSASFAALPVLADIATGRRPGSVGAACSLAGRIVAGEEQLHEPGYARTHYPESIADLHRITLHHLIADTLAGDSDAYLGALENLLAFEGVPVWRATLGFDVHCIECPSCTTSLEADFYESTPGIRRRDPSSRIQRITPRDPTLIDIRPTAPADLCQLASRLHRMAAAADQSAVAEHLRHLFGRTNCPDCRADFSVPEQIEAFLSK